LFIEDGHGSRGEDLALRARLPRTVALARVVNKIDLEGGNPGRSDVGGETVLRISAKTGAGVAELRAWLLEIAGWRPHGEGVFLARERHLVALEAAKESLEASSKASQAIELQAEELRITQEALGRITGEVSADDLLGEIFSRFCIGK
ncbi:MAG: tRNA uridine-5-carboxymethylaminomethyl(34) synthesis GTPase MnmE, partial [Usitatibacter sp.]